MSVATKERAPAIEITGHRQDTEGKWYVVATAPCDECGCDWDYSVDQPGVLWEPGPDIDEECSDPECLCHVAPIMGMPFLVHLAS
jgi:hypothetical protein